jgi:hypothetical protein
VGRPDGAGCAHIVCKSSGWHCASAPRKAGMDPTGCHRRAGKRQLPAGLLLACAPRVERAALRLLPRAPHPAVTRSHARAETGQRALARVLHPAGDRIGGYRATTLSYLKEKAVWVEFTSGTRDPFTLG